MKFYDLKIVKQLQCRFYENFSEEVYNEYDEYMSEVSKIELEQREKVLPLLSKELAELFSRDFIHDSFIKTVNLKRFKKLNKFPEVRLTIYGYNVKGILTYKDVVRYKYDDTFTDKAFQCECLFDELYLDEDNNIVHSILQHPFGEISVTAKSIEWKSLLK